MNEILLSHFQEGNTYVYTQEKVNKDRRLNFYNGKFLSRGSIYRAYIPFKESPNQYKIRPVIILNDSNYTDKEVNVIPCTTAITSDSNFKLNQVPYLKYPILEWKQNGFDDPSYAIIDYDKDSQDYYLTIDKRYILEPMLSRNTMNYKEFLMTSIQFKEILKVLIFLKKGIPITRVNSKADPKSEFFDWKTMQVPKDAWEEYRNKSLAKDKEREEAKALQKEEKLKQDFKNLRLYYLYDKDSKSVGDMTYSEKIFKDNRPRKCRKTKDWATYEAYMGKYFSVIDNIQDEINPKYKDMFPTKKEVMELEEHILSDEELRIFLEESL